ncbi:GntR family transcriptional regulator [Halanaerobiaceae bacterium Z-7014]|uniref:GntR family transcriptional regulator n=1 Tax=Halonatronomonas betaini TaxID=2778430 RepID=A0A931F8N8_9FIRM|nr:GntR family transcriptional regulator [Halonatronomonas betaini]MBF8435569.1 GntR family transcriptional regulator [Halonatronomonas betaini]
MDLIDNKLDKDTPVPLYYQLKNIIKEQIEKGYLKPGDTVPPERILAESYDVSRPTIRKALSELVNEGLLNREKGKGTFVSEPKFEFSFVQKLMTFYDDMVTKGFKPKTNVITKELKEADRDLAEKLSISVGDKYIYIKRVRSIKGEPIVIVENHIPYHLCEDIISINLSDKSLYNSMYEKCGLENYRAEMSIAPALANHYDSKLLEIDAGSPIHHIKTISYTKDNIPMDYFESRFRGDRGEIKVNLCDNGI